MRYGLTALSAFLLAGACFAEDPGVMHVRSEYQSIRKALPSLKAESVKLPDYSTEGGNARAFRDGKRNIRLVRAQLFAESGKDIQEYYYEKGALIFVLYSHHSYNVPVYVTARMAAESGGEAFDPKKTRITEDRYYFSGGRMIQWLNDKGSPVSPAAGDFKIAENEVREMAGRLLSHFRK